MKIPFFPTLSALWLVLASPSLFAGQLTLYVFEKGRPAGDIAVTLDGTGAGRTASDGRLVADIDAGSHRVALARDGEALASFEFESTAEESADASVTLTPGAEPQVAVNTYNGGPRSGRVRGMLRGRIVSRTSGAPLSGATVAARGLEASAVSDEVGIYELELPRGHHEITVTHAGYKSRTLRDVAIVGNVVQEANVRLSGQADTVPRLPPMEELNVVATYVPDDGSIESINTDQREAFGVTEVLGVDQMLRAGDANAADALRRVTGLTVQDDKYIVIRGQPERYTQTTLNGSLLPSPDPIRRIVPLDLFPTGSLAKIDIRKSYDAAAPGSFGGGLIGLETAGVPDETLRVSVKTGGNTRSTGQTGYDYDGGDDALGYDDGTRDLPAGLAGASTPDAVTDAARGFDNTWALRERELPVDTGLGLGAGRYYEAGGADLGASFSFGWERKFRHTERVERDYALRNDGGLAVRNNQVENRTDMNVNLNSLLLLSAEWDNHSLRSNTLLLRKSTRRSALTEGTRVVSDDLFIRDTLLEWNERELFAQQFTGEHRLGRVVIDWRAMQADSTRDSPDRRDYLYRRQSNGQYVFHSQTRANRRFDNNDDDITGLGADIRYEALYNGAWKIDLSGGMDAYEQDRESRTRRFSFRPLAGADLAAAPEALLNPAELGDTLAVTDQTQANDNYRGSAEVDAGYLKTDIDWADNLRVTAGVRRENAEFGIRTFQAGGSGGDRAVEAGFDQSDTLPSLSVTWRFMEDMQLRLSSGRSLSRPMLNELSPARYFDPETNEEYLGNPDLQPAVIDSLDARWEWYLSERELLSLGVFSKDYTDPIEQSFVGVGGSAFLRQIKNADKATVNGTEATARIELTRVLPESWTGVWSDMVYVQANAAFIDSEVELNAGGLETRAERPLQGQADAVYNLQVGYDGERHDLDLSYNRTGERLQIAGVQGQPDVYQQPLDRLDLNYTWRLTESIGLKLKGGNLLDTEMELTQGGEIFRAYKEGRSYSVSLSWRME